MEKSASPLAAAVREVREEPGVDLDVAELLVMDWAPHPAEGDKLLVIFRGGTLTADDVASFTLHEGEITTAEFFHVDQLHDLMPARLARRVTEAAARDHSTYLEHGRTPGKESAHTA